MKWWVACKTTSQCLLLLTGMLAAVTPAEHARRVAKMREIAAQSNGKIEIIVEAVSDSIPQQMNTPANGAAVALAFADMKSDGVIVQPASQIPVGSMEGKVEMSEQELNRLYPSALHLIYTKKDQKALAILDQLLEARPEHEQTALIQYWAGECCWNLGLLDKAKEHFIQAAKHRGIAKAELATLKLAMIADRNSDADAGKQLLRQLLQDYPNGDGAIIARPLLDKYGLN